VFLLRLTNEPMGISVSSVSKFWEMADEETVVSVLWA
jgi:hypothetical protein